MAHDFARLFGVRHISGHTSEDFQEDPHNVTASMGTISSYNGSGATSPTFYIPSRGGTVTPVGSIQTQGSEETSVESDGIRNTNLQVGQRRPHPDEPPPPRNRVPAQLLRVNAREKAYNAQLPPDQVSEVSEFSELSIAEMMVDIKIHLLKNENALSKRHFALFSRHPHFMVYVRHNVAGILLSAETPAYLDTILKQICLWLEKDPGLLGLLPAAKDDPADWGQVRNVITRELTNLRSTSKSKIEASIIKKDDIYALTNALLVYDMRPTVAHWGRFALLRDVAVKYTAMKSKKLTYWQSVDNRLKQIRNEVKLHWPREQWRQKISDKITDILHEDTRRYPVQSGEFWKTSYTIDGLNKTQRNASKAAERFDIGDKVILEPQAEDG